MLYDERGLMLYVQWTVDGVHGMRGDSVRTPVETELLQEVDNATGQHLREVASNVPATVRRASPAM